MKLHKTVCYCHFFIRSKGPEETIIGTEKTRNDFSTGGTEETLSALNFYAEDADETLKNPDVFPHGTEETLKFALMVLRNPE